MPRCSLAHLVCLWMASALCACDCGGLTGGASGASFEHCAAIDPPASRTIRAGALTLQIEGRVLALTSQEAALDLAVFSGPIGAPLTRNELAKISEAAPDLVIMFGGLGDSEADASASLAGLTALAIPTLFIAGGADHRELLEDAFDGLSEQARDLVIHASGLRELRFGQDSFAIMPGAADGRYARDEESCGFDGSDVDALTEALDGSEKRRVWLLSWEAPSGWGLGQGLGGSETASASVRKVADTLKAKGGLFAYPESVVFTAMKAPAGGLAMVVPRLGRTGATRAGGGRVQSSLATLTLGSSGLALR